MARRCLASVGSLAALSLLAGSCDGGETSGPRSDRVRPIESTIAFCRVGERPGYFVPADGPVALLGCSRLGVSGKRIEFSANLGRIDGESHLCVNPAYSGRGRRGFFIPAVCKLVPPPQRFAVRDLSRPRPGVRGYALVIWGTAAASTSEVEARFSGGAARAAVFNVEATDLRRFGEAPFSLFVLEVPRRAACGPVTLERDRSDSIRLPPRPDLCPQRR
jgi:hypothetical protein